MAQAAEAGKPGLRVSRTQSKIHGTGPGQGQMHRVAFTTFHDVTSYPARGVNSRSGTTGRVAAPGLGTLRSVDPLDAPVAFTLHRPDGSAFDLRMVDGILMRPLRLPRSRLACGVDDLRRALASRPDWRDDPLSKPMAATGRVYRQDRHGRPEAHEIVASAKRFDPYDDALRSAMGEAAAAMARLAEVDGVVMMPCPEPRLNVVALKAKGNLPRRFCVAWEFPDHGYHDDPRWGRIDDGFEKDHGHLPLSPGAMHVAFPLASRDASDKADAWETGLATFAIDREADARAFSRSVAASRKTAVEEMPMVVHADGMAVAHADEVSLIPAAVRKAFGPWASHDWSDLLAADDATVRDWMQARTAVAAWPDLPDEEAFRAGMDMTVNLARRTGVMEKWSTLAVALHRWEASERHRDLSEVAWFRTSDDGHAMSGFTA